MQSGNWSAVCWGHPPSHLGRGPAALKTALDLDADHLIFGMGGGKADWVAEAPDPIYPILLSNVDELTRFDAFTPARRDAAQEMLSNRVVFAPDANGSTMGELHGLKRLLSELGVETLVLVSSPDHLPRCLRDAQRVFESRHELSIQGAMAQTMATDALPEIVEKPHRPDRPADDLHATTKRLLGLPANERRRLLDVIDREIRRA